jgi:dihydrofolate reductase
VARVIYSFTTSLDGYIAGPEGEIDWSTPDDELHRFHNEQVREVDIHLCGRRLYETMSYWDTAHDDWGDVQREFAGIWRALPKVVFSSTLKDVGPNARLADRDLAAEIAELRRQPDLTIAVGGAMLGSAAAQLDLIDEYRVFVAPVLLGSGTPYVSGPHARLDLELRESRTLGSLVVYLRCERVRA